MQRETIATGRRPVPKPTALTKPFWEGCRSGELLVQQCQDCGHKFFPPLVTCNRCFSLNVTWVKSSGKGVLYTFGVIHQAWPGFPMPTVLAVVDLDDGYSMLTNIVGCASKDVTFGMPVEVTFEKLTEEIYLPLFRPRKEST
jgi:uncharacterized OB-fold protein